MIRIGINTLFMIPGEVGGSETLLMESVRALALHPSAPQIVLFANHENGALFQKTFGDFPGLTVKPSGLRATRRCNRILYEQTLLPLRAARANLTVLWSPGYTAPLLYRRPQVLSVLDMQYRRYPEDLGWAARRTTDLLIRLGVKRCRRVMAISEFTRREILRFTKPAGEVDVVPLGVDTRLGRASDPAADKAWLAGHGLRAPYCLCVANTYPHKNVAALVEAFGLLSARLPHRLALVGKARRGEPAVAAAIAAARLGARLIRFERLEPESLAALYRGADLFVFPSLYEGFGLPVIEAMMAGTAVLANRRAEAVVEIGGQAMDTVATGSARELAEAIPAILARPAKQRRQKIEGARQRAATFNWTTSAERLLNCLRAAAAEFPISKHG